MPICVKRREMLNPMLTKAFLQPAKAAAMRTASRAETHPPPPIPPFLLAQNLSSKWIMPTDNMRPKLCDIRQLKGQHNTTCMTSLIPMALP